MDLRAFLFLFFTQFLIGCAELSRTEKGGMTGVISTPSQGAAPENPAATRCQDSQREYFLTKLANSSVSSFDDTIDFAHSFANTNSQYNDPLYCNHCIKRV